MARAFTFRKKELEALPAGEFKVVDAAHIRSVMSCALYHNIPLHRHQIRKGKHQGKYFVWKFPELL